MHKNVDAFFRSCRELRGAAIVLCFGEPRLERAECDWRGASNAEEQPPPPPLHVVRAFKVTM